MKPKPDQVEAPAEPESPEEAFKRVLDANGQMVLPLDGKDYVIRPSFKAIAAIERQLRPLMQLATAASSGLLTIEEQALITCEMMRAYGEANPDEEGIADYKGANREQLGDLIYEAGSPRICARLMVVLTGAVNGGYTASGEAKPATETTKK